MTKRLAEAAFEIMSQGRAKDAKRARPMLDTIAIENALTDVLEHIEVVSDHVEFMTLRYDSLINHLADYVGQDLGELWTQNENTKPIDFMNGIENDVEALLSKSSEWRCQDGLGHLTASWLKVFRGVSDDVLTGWLRQKAPSGKTFSDSLYQAIEIIQYVGAEFGKFWDVIPDATTAYELAAFSGLAAPPPIIDPTRRISVWEVVRDNRSEPDESDESESEDEWE